MQHVTLLSVVLRYTEKAISLTKKRLYKLWDQKNPIHIYCAKQTANAILFEFKHAQFLREIAFGADEVVSRCRENFASMDQRCDCVSSQVRVVCDPKMVIMATTKRQITGVDRESN